MKHILKFISLPLIAMSVSSCYEDYVYDYEYPNMGFSLDQPLRTVVSGTNKIYVGVSIGGKREIDMNDWATFELDETLLEGTGKELMPSDYYTLDDPNTFRVRRANLAIADVGISFTEDFYDDPLSLTAHYALPFRVTGTSIPGDESQPNGAIREGGETSIVVVKYISSYSGTYYRLGSVTEVDADGTAIGDPVVYEDKDLNKNVTVALTTELPDVVLCPGLGNNDTSLGTLRLALDDSDASSDSYTVAVTCDGATLVSSECTYLKEGDYTFWSSDRIAPQFNLAYTYQTSDGKYFKVDEKLVLRRYAEEELKVEEWS